MNILMEFSFIQEFVNISIINFTLHDNCYSPVFIILTTVQSEKWKKIFDNIWIVWSLNKQSQRRKEKKIEVKGRIF